MYAFVISILMVYCRHSVAVGASLYPSRHCVLTNKVVSAPFVKGRLFSRWKEVSVLFCTLKNLLLWAFKIFRKSQNGTVLDSARSLVGKTMTVQSDVLSVKYKHTGLSRIPTLICFLFFFVCVCVCVCWFFFCSLSPFYGEDFYCEIPRTFRHLSFYIFDRDVFRRDSIIGMCS